MKVGYAGMGMMGSAMARNLMKAGHEVTVWNRTRSKAEPVRTMIADYPEELCKNEVIFVCVSNDAALKDVLYSDDGIFKTLTSDTILIDCSTTSVHLTTEIAKKCKEKKAEFLDAPVTGGKNGAEKASLMFMIGGEAQTIEKTRELFNAMGKKIVHCGPNSYGQRMKIALNITQSMILQSYLEGLALALKNGISIEAAMEVFDSSGAKNGVAQAKMPAILERDFSPTFYLELMNKDMKLAEQEIKKLKLDLPIAEDIIKIMQIAHDKGWHKEDWAAFAKLLEEKSGVRFQK